MEKSTSSSSSSRILCSSFSLAEVVSFLILNTIHIWITSLIQKLSRTFFSYSPRTNCAGERIKLAKEEDRMLTREDVEMIMEGMGMPLIISSACSEKLPKDFPGSSARDELSMIFDDKEPSLEEVKDAFRVFDDNCDGFIDSVELQTLLCKLGFREDQAELDACRQMIDEHDQDKDGMIDFNEFVRFMESSFCWFN